MSSPSGRKALTALDDVRFQTELCDILGWVLVPPEVWNLWQVYFVE